MTRRGAPSRPAPVGSPTQPRRSELEDMPPPWIALPELTVDDAANQGLAETYVALSWLPFWRSLAPDGKASYLDRWAASPGWRAAIALRYDQEGFNAEADTREAEQWVNARRQTAPAGRGSLWNWLRRRGGRWHGSAR